MVASGRIIRLGGVRFTATEANFLQAGIRRGVGVRQMRTIFREQFDRGLPSTAFTEARSVLTQSELAGIRLKRLGEGRRLRPAGIPRIEVVRPRSRFVLTGKIRARIPSTGQIIERLVRFGTDEPPTLAMFRQRAQEIIDKGVKNLESAMILEETEGISVVEQVAV